MDVFGVAPLNPLGCSVIILGEIFGLTDYIKDVCKRYAGAGVNAYAPALYNRLGKECFTYSQEEEAHAASTKVLKVDEALLDIRATVEHAKPHGSVALIGFSYGATLGWLAAFKDNDISYLGGYYGNRIALNLDQRPHCPYDLIFGLDDHGLTPERLVALKDNLPPQNVHFLKAVHGFDCHHRPSTFNEKLSNESFQLVLGRLRGVSGV